MAEQPYTPPFMNSKIPEGLKIKFSLKLKLILSFIFINLILASGSFFNLPLILIFVLAMILSILSIFIVIFLLKPLDKLRNELHQIGEGHVQPLSATGKKDEVGDLATLIAQTTQNLVHNYQTVTTQKEALSIQANKLGAIISSLNDSLIVLDMHKQIVLANKAAEELSGFEPGGMIGRPIDQAISLMEQEGKKLDSSIFCPIELDPNSPPQTYRSPSVLTLIGKNIKKSQVKLIATPINSSIKADLGCILIFSDASNEKSLESMQLDFVSMASHELRTPLTSIMGYLSVLMNEGKDKFDAEQKQFLERILASAQQLQSLVNNLLNVSKVERGAFSLASQPIEWPKTLQKVVDDNQIQATQKNITLTLKPLPSNTPPVQADVLRISEVLNNLIGNAIKYTQNGGTIEVGSEIHPNEVITYIADNGAGISKEALSHLFTKFFRVTNALDKSSNSKGNGLGLYLSKSIVEMHKGRIWVESGIGKGTTFYFTLPIAEGSKGIGIPSPLGPIPQVAI